MEKTKKRSPWAWIPTLYFAQGIPYFAVNTISVLMFKRLGMSNADIALYTGWLYLPWVIKPFWSPFVDIIKTKRWWTVLMQIIVAVALAGVALTLPSPEVTKDVLAGVEVTDATAAPVSSFIFALAIFWVMAFASATHDIASDGYYMLALNTNEQSLFVGIRSTFYRLASIFGQGVIVILAGMMETGMQDIPAAWRITFIVMSVFFGVVALYHTFILPRPASDRSVIKEGEKATAKTIVNEFARTFGTFFRKPFVWLAILFMLLYRLPEAQLIKIIQPFLVDPMKAGGLGLDTASVGIAYGTIGIIGLTVGGIVGGICASNGGLKKWIWPMALCFTLNSLVYVFLSNLMPDYTTVAGKFTIYGCVFLEQFSYGFGFTAFMLFMMYFADGEHKTSHYAICTAFMALGMMIPGMFAGQLEEFFGYKNFFWWVLACNAATLLVTFFVYPKIDPKYGRKEKKPKKAE
ncbi:MAG: MFS transporter [Muribaculaceae bacterium]|nr:MFS transporter [Muribaculaceae bacterium]MBR5435278.1 MFS transporter [Muribaculaceae bacterium]